jgi:hypothetical protein
MSKGPTWVEAARRNSPLYFFVLLAAAILAAAMLMPGGRAVQAAAFVLAPEVLGYLAALILFVGIDDDMRSLRTLVLGTVSGTALINTRDIVASLDEQFRALASSWLAGLYFLAIGGAIVGFVAGYMHARLWIEPDLTVMKIGLERTRALVPEVPSLPWPEFSEDWPALAGGMPDEKVLAEVKQVQDWSKVPAPDAIRAAAVMLLAGDVDIALRASAAAMTVAEPPSPSAFDLYAAALVKKHGAQRLPDESVRELERHLARMLTYWGSSFLVLLDAGFVYLYVAGQAALAEHYTRRALALRPNSPAANLNLACALAQTIGQRVPADREVTPIIEALDRFLAAKPRALDGRFLREGDFAYVMQNATFAGWWAQRSAPLSPPQPPPPSP